MSDIYSFERENKFSVMMGLIVILLSQINVEAGEDKQKLSLKPTLKFKTLSEYEAECKEPSVVLDSDFVIMFAPKAKAKEAKIIFGYLVKAYDDLYHIVGRHTEYKIAVYHFPENNEHGWGGTHNCEIGYSYKNLDLTSQKEWQQYRVPHVSGYIEEMAHSFVHASKIQFGWEMVGWSVGIQTTRKNANNPIFLKNLKDTWKKQRTTFYKYTKGGYVFPEDLPANLCDRIHAYILWKCETKYGRNFWPDFFKEIRKEYAYLRDAARLGGDKERNKRYQIAVDCFDRLEGLNFRAILKTANISLTTDVKALHPMDTEWDRKFISADPANNIVYGIHSVSKQAPVKKTASQKKPLVNTNTLPPLHKAAFGAHSGKTKQLVKEGADLNERGPNGWTPLHLAAIGGHRILSEYLLNEGADISIKDISGRSATKLAEIFGHSGLTEFLKEKETRGAN